ncbi:MAG TPA: asparagine synthase-related protein, partial [Solirubrobacteraceae bacterium]|nr:asparagine synthase-related protein [Solirubrobacteraceae bacterium]
VVIWDAASGCGLLATDVLATRQLYTRRVADELLFAGEVRDLLPLLATRPAPDAVAFPAWLVSGACPEGTTLYDGIHRLGPGECITLEDGTAATRTYWRPRFAGTMTAGRAEIVDGLRTTILDVSARPLSTGTDGVILSGGLDSSIVAAAAHAGKDAASRLHTYSAIFPGAPYDETAKIRELTSSLGVDARMFEIAPRGMVWQALEYLRAWQVPLAGMGAIVDLAAAERAAADDVSVMLDGQTGDEVLGFAPYLVADRLRRGRLLAALRLIEHWPGRPPARLHQRLWLLREIGVKGALPHRLGQAVRDRRAEEGDGPGWLLPHLRVQESGLEDRWAWKLRGSGPLWWRHLADLQVYGPHREPRLEYLRHRAAAVGVAGVSPLYDPDLIQYTLSIPPELQFDPRVDRPLARDAARGLLPDSVRLQRQKADFTPFCQAAITGADADGMERVLTAPDAEIGAYVDLEWVHRHWADLRRSAANGLASLGVLWHLASAEAWLRVQSDPAWVDEVLAAAVIPRVATSEAPAPV